MSSHTPDSTLGTRLCIECEGLRLDDEGCGGFIGTADNGTPALTFKHEEIMGVRLQIHKLLMRQQ